MKSSSQPESFRRGATADLHQPKLLIVFFLLPTLLVYGLFFLYPMAASICISFQKGGATSSHFTFAGFDNYRTMFRDKVFWSTLKHNLALLFVGGALTLSLATLLAVCLCECRRGRGFFRTVFLFPNVMAIVATTILWSFVFNPAFGIFNSLLGLVHLPNLKHAWLNEPHTAIWSVVIIFVWSAAGFYIVLLNAGLLRIPE
jgi:N-acetylglucosamine transport system permease protein